MLNHDHMILFWSIFLFILVILGIRKIYIWYRIIVELKLKTNRRRSKNQSNIIKNKEQIQSFEPKLINAYRTIENSTAKSYKPLRTYKGLKAYDPVDSVNDENVSLRKRPEKESIIGVATAAATAATMYLDTRRKKCCGNCCGSQAKRKSYKE